jgi:chorismate mutase
MLWDKKIAHIKEDEMLIYIRERINEILEKRSQEYMKDE